MSTALLKKSLEIVQMDMDTPGNTRNDKKNSKRMNKKGKETNKHSSRIKGVQKYSIKQAHSKINSTQSIVDDNVRKLLLLSSGKSDMKKVEKIIKHTHRNNAMDIIKQNETKAKTEESVFTDEDFANFAKEYFGS